MRELARQCIRDIAPYEPGKPIEELQRELGLKRIIKIASNENPVGLSKKAIRAIRKACTSVNRYPDGNCFSLRQKLCRQLGVDGSNIVFGNGSNEIIELVTRAYLNEGEEAVMPYPAFLIFGIAVAIQGGKAVSVPVENFRYDLNAMRKAINSKTKLVFIDNPNNPLGISVGKKELEEFLKSIPENVILVLDEAYNEFVERPNFPNGLEYLEAANVVVTRTFSKAFGLSGLRIGYGIAKKEIIEYLERVRQPFNVNSLAQAAALASLDDAEFIDKIKKMVKDEKRIMYKNLESMNIKYVASDTNFILINSGMNSRELFKLMLKEGIIVRDMCAYGLENYIRVTIGKPDENKRFIKVFRKILSRRKKS